MAIRIYNDIGAIGGLGAYYGAYRQARNRARKYQIDRMDHYRQQQQQQQFMFGLDALRGQRQAEMQQQQDLNRIALQNLANMQAEDRQKEAEKRAIARDDVNFARRQAAAQVAGLDIPAWVPPHKIPALQKKIADAQAFLKPDTDWNDADVKQKFSGVITDFNTSLYGQYDPDTGLTVGGIPKPSQAEHENALTTYRDKSGVAYDKPGEGRIPYRDGKPLEQLDPLKTPYNQGLMQDYKKNLTTPNEEGDLPSEGVAYADAKELQDKLERGRQRILNPQQGPEGRPVSTIGATPQAQYATMQKPPAGAAQGFNPAASLIPQPKSQQEYDALAVGDIYIGSDGKPRRKGAK